ncbi:MAG: phosphoserine phosphatase [Candidatus Thermoplasmatota archaeon]|jgi:uncharacterized coiled-coil DUF342 family protein|nr:phosphoserine phosphatase [Candidatus Thermoplasmatota archaeon]
MSEILPDFEKKREILRNLADEHINKRDELSQESRYYAEERDKLNQKSKSLRESVMKKIDEKGSLIATIQKMRDEKEEFYKEYAEIRKELRKNRENFKSTGVDPMELKKKERELDKLIKVQQTQPMDKNDEKKVVLQIRKLNNEIMKSKERMESEIKGNDSIKKLSDETNEKKKVFEQMKKEIDELSNQINKIGDEINTGLKELDETRKKADGFHEMFIKFSKDSEKEHEEFVKAKIELRDIEKMLGEKRAKTRAFRKKEKEGELQTKANDLFEKFKKGEQLTTEDLMVLQKAGFL